MSGYRLSFRFLTSLEPSYLDLHGRLVERDALRLVDVPPRVGDADVLVNMGAVGVEVVGLDYRVDVFEQLGAYQLAADDVGSVDVPRHYPHLYHLVDFREEVPREWRVAPRTDARPDHHQHHVEPDVVLLLVGVLLDVDRRGGEDGRTLSRVPYDVD